MQVLKLLVRVAFICNICFLSATLILRLPDPPEGGAVSTVIVLGYLMGLPLNAIVLGWSLAPGIRGKWRTVGAPLWLMVVNFVFFCFQLVLLILHLTT